jgi:hypothetical protein
MQWSAWMRGSCPLPCAAGEAALMLPASAAFVLPARQVRGGGIWNESSDCKGQDPEVRISMPPRPPRLNPASPTAAATQLAAFRVTKDD